MFGNFSQQLKKSTKPASTLLEMNAKTLELVSKQQTVFFSGVMSDSVKLVETLSDQTELKGMIAAHSVYAESVRERLTSASKSTYGAISEMSNEMAGVVKSTLADVSEDAKTVVTTAVESAKSAASPVAKKPAVKKAAPKKTAAKKAPAKQAASKAEVKTAAAPVKAKPTTKKPVAKKAVAAKTVTAQATPPVVEKPVAKKPAATPISAPKKALAKKAAPKKKVAELSPADVKADSSKKA
ncbi:phasin family protein [Ningiella sp. W23]|uniref:phasin family protein n=1 Tax=Ningiella sp. W23 TaxID=3023715 RepID=UPI0037582ADF